MTYSRIIQAMLPVMIPVLFCSCFNTKKKELPFAGYNMAKAEKFNMPGSLLEVSGICFYNGVSDTVYAIQDEDGKVFKLKWEESRQFHTKFGKKGDYEDLTIIKDQVIVLKSNGTLFSFPFAEMVNEETENVKEWTGVLPQGEYEGMYGDPVTGEVYVLCKKCEADDSDITVSGFILSLNDSMKMKGRFAIDVQQVKQISGKGKKGFRPSALARHPITGEWFVVSGVNKMIIVANSDWKIKETCPLNVNLFNQPEGIAFDNQGNLYISNEGDDLSDGNVLRFAPAKSKP